MKMIKYGKAVNLNAYINFIPNKLLLIDAKQSFLNFCFCKLYEESNKRINVDDIPTDEYISSSSMLTITSKSASWRQV